MGSRSRPEWKVHSVSENRRHVAIAMWFVSPESPPRGHGQDSERQV